MELGRGRLDHFQSGGTSSGAVPIAALPCPSPPAADTAELTVSGPCELREIAYGQIRGRTIGGAARQCGATMTADSPVTGL